MKSSPDTTSKAKSAVPTRKPAKSQPAPILDAPRIEIPSTPLLRRGPAPKYDINVRPSVTIPGAFQLYNYDAPAGARLIKGDGFPLMATSFIKAPPWFGGWTHYDNREDAEAAAFVLQEYLDKWEAK